ncbi:hypothetical protein Hypma_013372 [Hypsizygus marmoreus]|uniref:Uncharacterized protein n=1 Tax=Hypsizygus marmoreus TaxID=39966 RepID=A0A369JJI8_HYPMA|nr:hypothetical protein Hypma_013372 [Hypsizygus marmoreus]
MPKVDAKIESETSFSISAQAEIKKYTSTLNGEKGSALRELEISFSTVDKNHPSNRGPLIAALLKRTPNLTKLTLNFSGPLNTYENCLGDALLEALCNLKDMQDFSHRRTTSARTDFGLLTLLKLVSSWPKLREVYISGDTCNVYGKDADFAALPPATCQLESVTFERCMSNYEMLAPMFAGSSQSLHSFEAWAMGHKEIDHIFLNVLPAIERIKIGGCDHPSPKFIIEHLSHAPKLSYISIGGNEDCNGVVRSAFAKALSEPDTFPALHTLAYPGKTGTYKTGRGPNVREHKHENPGEDELVKAARERNIRVYIADNLEYKVEGAQRRAGFAAMGRRGWY